MVAVPKTSYPGVYIQEVPSGVRTIAGVSTSIALFLGRAARGELNNPKRCLNYTDFERAFSAEAPGDYLAHYVRLFFMNGGTDCYVMRLAEGQANADVTLKSEFSGEVLKLTAKDAGSIGEQIRAEVSYPGNNPEGVFDISLFRWGLDSNGSPNRLDVESHPGLTMNPSSSRYAPNWITQNSKLVNAEPVGAVPAIQGYSLSGRPVEYRTANDAGDFIAQWANLIGGNPPATANQFTIILNGNKVYNVDLQGLAVNQALVSGDFPATQAKLKGFIEGEIKRTSGCDKVEIEFVGGPNAQDSAVYSTCLLCVRAIAKGDDVAILSRGGGNDAAGPLMLGTANGGLEVGAYAASRPAPTGLWLRPWSSDAKTPDVLVDFAGLRQGDITQIRIGEDIVVDVDLAKKDPAQPLYIDKNGERDGVREKMEILAAAVKNRKDVPWTAERRGSRLYLSPIKGDDNLSSKLVLTKVTPILANAIGRNVRYYVIGGKQAPTIDLPTEAGVKTLTLSAKTGKADKEILIEIAYPNTFSESLFNLAVTSGDTVESWSNLSMNTASARYAPTWLATNSTFVDAALIPGSPPASKGYSLSGKPIEYVTTPPSDFADVWKTLISGRQFHIRVGAREADVELTSADLTGTDAAGLIANIEAVINGRLNPAGTTPAVNVAVSFPPGPAASSPDKATSFFRITAVDAGKDVVVTAATANDLTAGITLGTAQGGLEVGAYAALRPAPTGICLRPWADDPANPLALLTLAGTAPDFINLLTLDSKEINVDLTTTDTSGAYNGAKAKLDGLASVVNAEAAASGIPWKAERWGYRLALLPQAGDAGYKGNLSVASQTVPFDGSQATSNVRFYSVGNSGTSAYQKIEPGKAAATDGTSLIPESYENAFAKIDQEVDLFNLMVFPPDRSLDDKASEWFELMQAVWGPASVFCQQRRAFLLMDAPLWEDAQTATNGIKALRTGLVKTHAAVFYPGLLVYDNGVNREVGATGAIAGLMARIDSTRGVWKAPAGTEADIRGIMGLKRRFSDAENGTMNPHAINTVRVFPNGIVNWGARTMDGDDDFGSEWKYIPIRRLALYMEESLYRGLKWVVFEPNDEPLWAQIRLNVGVFMHDLFRQGAFQGKSPSDAYFVKCDKETTTQSDRDKGMVNIWVGFAPLKPAEFVILYLQQMAGQLQV